MPRASRLRPPGASPRVAPRAVGLLLAAILPAGSAAAGTPSVAPRCIALSVERGGHDLTNRCRFAVDVRSCALLDRRATCGRHLAEGSIAPGATLHVELGKRDELHYAACPFGDVFDTAWIRGGAGGFDTTCLSVGD